MRTVDRYTQCGQLCVLIVVKMCFRENFQGVPRYTERPSLKACPDSDRAVQKTLEAEGLAEHEADQGRGWHDPHRKPCAASDALV